MAAESYETTSYKELYEQALYHLRCVSGSRNSFSPEMRERMFDVKLPSIPLRTEAVEEMHINAARFLQVHDK